MYHGAYHRTMRKLYNWLERKLNQRRKKLDVVRTTVELTIYNIFSSYDVYHASLAIQDNQKEGALALALKSEGMAQVCDDLIRMLSTHGNKMKKFLEKCETIYEDAKKQPNYEIAGLVDTMMKVYDATFS
jgi:hypothetical protein